jgi:hypothetical protein
LKTIGQSVILSIHKMYIRRRWHASERNTFCVMGLLLSRGEMKKKISDKSYLSTNTHKKRFIISYFISYNSISCNWKHLMWGYQILLLGRRGIARIPKYFTNNISFTQNMLTLNLQQLKTIIFFYSDICFLITIYNLQFLTVLYDFNSFLKQHPCSKTKKKEFFVKFKNKYQIFTFLFRFRIPNFFSAYCKFIPLLLWYLWCQEND